MVIHFEYLWRYEHKDGNESGSKRRPCVIIVAVKEVGGKTVVVIAPVTHLEPSEGQGVEVPPKVKSHLGLDKKPSWVIVDDLNTFEWPGVDIHPIPNAPPGTYEYGSIPPALLEKIKKGIEEAKSMETATKRAG